MEVGTVVPKGEIGALYYISVPWSLIGYMKLTACLVCALGYDSRLVGGGDRREVCCCLLLGS